MRLPSELNKYQYKWSPDDCRYKQDFAKDSSGRFNILDLNESDEALSEDSRWPMFFPSPIVFVSLPGGALEKVVGASIVNRFPYTLALSFCKNSISSRHYARENFCRTLEEKGEVSVQFLAPGADYDAAMKAITDVPDSECQNRCASTGLDTHPSAGSDAPIFNNAYMVYEGRLVRPGTDYDGRPIFSKPWVDSGSHRIYFIEISVIQLKENIAKGDAQIQWRSLPEWTPSAPLQNRPEDAGKHVDTDRYQKGFTPYYAFPSKNTTAFEFDAVENGMAIKKMPADPGAQVEVSNDRARWPCFFPSSVGMITAFSDDRQPNLMPCGSTTLLSRNPLTVACCVSYAKINERYAPRKTLDFIGSRRSFGCGVPFVDDAVLEGIMYAGTTSFAVDSEKIEHSGLEVITEYDSPIIAALPIHMHCEVIDEINLGTHVLFLGKVTRIFFRSDFSRENPIEWCPIPALSLGNEE